jgi:hypothetical protein
MDEDFINLEHRVGRLEDELQRTGKDADEGLIEKKASIKLHECITDMEALLSLTVSLQDQRKPDCVRLINSIRSNMKEAGDLLRRIQNPLQNARSPALTILAEAIETTR